MKRIALLLLICAAPSLCYGQSKADLFKAFEEIEDALNTERMPNKESIIELRMAIIQAGNDNVHNDDVSQVRVEINQLAQEMKELSIGKQSVQPNDKIDQETTFKDSDNVFKYAVERGSNKDVTELVNRKKDMTLLSVPVLTAQAGVTAVAEIGQATPLPYFERIDGDTFKLRYSSPRVLGMEISMLLSEPASIPTNNGSVWGVRLSPVQLAVTGIDGRETVESIDLPIGKPIITRRSIETSLQLAEGEPGIIELPVAKGKHVFIIIFANIRK